MSRSRTAEAHCRSILDKRRKGETLVSLARRQGVNLSTLHGWHQCLAKRARERGEGPSDTGAMPWKTSGSGAGPQSLRPSRSVHRTASTIVLTHMERFPAALRSAVENLTDEVAKLQGVTEWVTEDLVCLVEGEE